MDKLLFQKEIHVPVFMFSARSLRGGSVLLVCFLCHCPLSASSLYELDPCSQWRERPLLPQVCPCSQTYCLGRAPRSGREPGSLAQSIPSGPGPRPRPRPGPAQEPRQAWGPFCSIPRVFPTAPSPVFLVFLSAFPYSSALQADSGLPPPAV